MWHVLDTKMKLSTAFQPLTDCQSEVIHKSALPYFASHVHMKSHHDLHKEVIDKIAQYNANYEMWNDIRKLFKIFNVGDVVLRASSTDLFQILKKLNCNVYVIDYNISSIFNIEDLVDYKVLILTLTTSLLMSHPTSLFCETFSSPNSKYFTYYSWSDW